MASLEESCLKNAETCAALQETIRHRFFYTPAFEIYGGYAGLFCLGPSGTALMDNILAEWRRHFILEDSVLEIKDSVVTPHPVLKASGHVDRFSDFLVRDNGEPFRADKLLEEAIDTRLEKLEKIAEMKAKLAELTGEPKKKEHDALAAEIVDLERIPREELEVIRNKADSYTAPELQQQFIRLRVLGPKTGQPITGMPEPFNLMFPTQIGAAANSPAFLRPELAQGMFVNFKRLYETVGKLPFACGQIGQVYRNEIAPRGGMFRLREFTLAEMEHFCKDDEKRHPKFRMVAGVPLLIWSRESQEAGQHPVQTTVGDALAAGRIGNETHAYFIGRTQLFLERCGIRPECIRFRQHLLKQMAHYARDCYDAEVLTASGWVEVVGIADRSCFDLTQHSRATGIDLVAHERLDPPIIIEQHKILPNKKEIGKVLKGAAQPVCAYLEALPEPEVRAFQESLAANGKVAVTVMVPAPVDKKAPKDAPVPPPTRTTVEVLPNMVEIKTVQTKQSDRTFIPAVIEPSFGISRIMSTVLEHCFYRRPEDLQRGVFRFPPLLAPVKCAVFPLSGDDRFTPYLQRIASDLVRLGISRTIDTSGVAIGRRYARVDEVGTPFAVTVDFDTVTAGNALFDTVTLRERDTTEQIRVKIADLAVLVRNLVEGITKWSEARAQYPAAARPASDDAASPAASS